MTLSNSDSAKLGYQADIEWFRKRIFELQSGFVNPSVSATQATSADQYIQNLTDLRSKAQKISDRIDSESAELRIPVDKTKDINIYNAVLTLDPPSGGEYITYDLYKSISEKIDAGNRNLKLDDLVSNSSNDIVTNSQLIQTRIYQAFSALDKEASPVQQAIAIDNPDLGKVISEGAKDYLYTQVMGYVSVFLDKYPSNVFIPWNFKQDAIGSLTSIDGLTNLWNHYSDVGKTTLTDFGNIFQDKPSLSPNPDLANYTDRFLGDTNKFLNDVNNLFNDFWISDYICCFTGFLVRLDTRGLEGLKSALSILQCSINFDFNDILKSIKSIFSSIIKNAIIYSLATIIDQVKQRLTLSLKSWIMNQNDPNWQKLFNCPPIKLLIETYLDEAIKSVDRFFNSILMELYKKLELNKIFNDSKLTQAGHNKWINTALSAIDAVLKILSLASVCGQNNSPSGDDVQQLINNLVSPQTAYVYPAESDPNIYNSFITQDQADAIKSGTISSSTGTSAAPIQTTNQTINQGASELSGVDRCKRMINDTIMPPSIIWTKT